MGNTQMYKQCRMEREVGPGSKLVHTAWIPSQFARVGKRLSIKDVDAWTEGWVVASVGGCREFGDLDRQRDAQKRWERVLDHGGHE